ncbi:hypothetical protein D3C75_1053200 [compost metagenome]
MLERGQSACRPVSGSDRLSAGFARCWRVSLVILLPVIAFSSGRRPAIERHVGDALLFPVNCHGVWDIRETVRKSFVIMP